MSITFFKDAKDSTRSYYRITRAINGVEKQEYVRIKADTERARQAALKKAEAIDERVANWQKSIRALNRMKGEHLILPSGKIIGLQLQYRERKNLDKPRVDIEFKLRIKLPEQPPIYRSFSIKRWGLEGAFEKSIELIADLKNVDTKGDRFKMMQQSIQYYYADYYLHRLCPEPIPEHIEIGDAVSSNAPEDKENQMSEEDLLERLSRELNEFQSKKEKKVISGR